MKLGLMEVDTGFIELHLDWLYGPPAASWHKVHLVGVLRHITMYARGIVYQCVSYTLWLINRFESFPIHDIALKYVNMFIQSFIQFICGH